MGLVSTKTDESEKNRTAEGNLGEGLGVHHISKHYPGVLALDEVSFNVQRGEVHALVGQNGAGKSTLMAVLSGSQQADKGDILLDDIPIEISDPSSARRHGIAIVHQEFALCPNMSVAQNIFVGNEPHNALGVVDFGRMRTEAARLLDQVQVELDPGVQVERLGVSEWQVIEICKALSGNPQFIIMDEPTAALNDHRVKDLLDVIRRLRDVGHGIVYISHKLSEVLEIADRITVMRDGKIDKTFINKGVSESDLVNAMIGGTFEKQYHHNEQKKIGQVALELSGVNDPPRFSDINLQLHSGEILGLTGILGAGCQDLVRTLFGINPVVSGEIRLGGEVIQLKNPQDAVLRGIGYIPADRKHEGLVLSLSTYDNVGMSIIDRLSNLGLFGYARQRALTGDLIEKLSIKVSNPKAPVKNLSGGNQQKVSVAKWLARGCKVLLFEEPTRGIDVEAKAQIWRLINALTEEGVAVMVVSSELPELMQACDRILVMRRGRIVDQFARNDFDEAEISMRAAADI
ncbi:MAG: sugar ABC transporter ATP-binding protein [Hyphomicrobiales bacterium]|nr:sugar ABC transporter ATP-binding protein [Hyphomicrobiales bacterium]